MKKLYVVVGSNYSNVTLEGNSLSVHIDKNNILIVKDKKQIVAIFKYWQYCKEI